MHVEQLSLNVVSDMHMINQHEQRHIHGNARQVIKSRFENVLKIGKTFVALVQILDLVQNEAPLIILQLLGLAIKHPIIESVHIIEKPNRVVQNVEQIKYMIDLKKNV